MCIRDSSQAAKFIFRIGKRRGRYHIFLNRSGIACFGCRIAVLIRFRDVYKRQVFGLDDINDLPIIYNIAWYEQKAVIVLLALLYLGVKLSLIHI